MKVILQQDVSGQGKKGSLVEVSDGYARNYLFPRKLAVEANAANMNVYKQGVAAKEHKLSEEKKAANELSAKLTGVTVKILAKGGTGGRLFGSVTSKEIVEQLQKQHGIEIDKKKIVVDDIKTFGTVEAECRIYTGIAAKFFVLVVSE